MFEEFLSYIARTNLFNFVIFLSIIIYLCKKINVTQKIEQAKIDVETSIEDSKTAKTESESRLTAIEQSMMHLEEEIESILKKSEDNAKLVGEKILQEADKTIESINDSAKKSLENAHNILKNELLNKAAKASVEVARSHILNELNNNADLHNKLIDESIEAIEGVEL